MFWSRYVIYQRDLQYNEVKDKIANDTLLQGLSKNEQAFWFPRIADVLEAPDNQLIERDVNAGKIKDSYLIMHNGIKVLPLSYCNYPNLEILIKNKGVHEPQEELVFAKVLEKISPGATMIELGSNWGFYSLWFKQKVKNANCYLIEPDPIFMTSGKMNFTANNYKATFLEACVGASSYKMDDGGNMICVDDFVKTQNIKFVDMLHCDIQGAELDMLRGADSLIENKKVGYIFISTHSNELHKSCLELLIKKGFLIVANANLDETYSFDGLIVARAPYYPGLDKVAIALKHK